MVVVDVPEPDHAGELDFWQAAVGQPFPQVADQPDYHRGQLHGQQTWMLVQRTGGGPPRFHVDFHTDDVEAEVARLESLGAHRVEKIQSWWVMRDPADLPFCVVPDPPGSLTDANAQRWD